MSGGEVCLVSDEDLPLLSRFSWYLQNKGYVCGRIGNGFVMIHRFVTGAKGAQIVDHINGDKLDNRRENLRIVNHSQNNQARSPFKRFPYIGVEKERQLWVAYIRKDGKRKRIGSFQDPIDAAKAYDKMAKKLYGDAAHTNEKFLKILLAKIMSKK